ELERREDGVADGRNFESSGHGNVFVDGTTRQAAEMVPAVLPREIRAIAVVQSIFRHGPKYASAHRLVSRCRVSELQLDLGEAAEKAADRSAVIQHSVHTFIGQRNIH